MWWFNGIPMGYPVRQKTRDLLEIGHRARHYMEEENAE